MNAKILTTHSKNKRGHNQNKTVDLHSSACDTATKKVTNALGRTTETKKTKKTKKLPDVAVCAVCRDPLMNRSVLSRLHCGHTFCPGCIGDWSSYCAQQKHTPSCPLCRGSAKIVEIVPTRVLLQGILS